MLIASVSHIRYAPFADALGPVALFGLALDAAVLVLLFRRDLRPGPLESRRTRGRGRAPRDDDQGTDGHAPSCWRRS